MCGPWHEPRSVQQTAPGVLPSKLIRLGRTATPPVGGAGHTPRSLDRSRRRRPFDTRVREERVLVDDTCPTPRRLNVRVKYRLPSPQKKMLQTSDKRPFTLPTFNSGPHSSWVEYTDSLVLGPQKFPSTGRGTLSRYGLRSDEDGPSKGTFVLLPFPLEFRERT